MMRGESCTSNFMIPKNLQDLSNRDIRPGKISVFAIPSERGINHSRSSRLSLGSLLKQNIQDILESNWSFLTTLLDIFVKTIDNYCHSVHLLINSQNSSCAKLFAFTVT